MNGYKEKMEELIEKNRKSSRKIPQEDSESYKKAWNSLIKEEGLKGDGEVYLYKGLKFDIINELISYIGNSKNHLEELLNGSHYTDKVNDTFTVTTQLLNHFLFSNDRKDEVVALLLKEYPDSSLNKEKNILKTSDSIFMHSFIKKLETWKMTYLPKWENITLDYVDKKHFVDFVEKLILDISHKGTKEYNRILEQNRESLERFKCWLSSLEKTDEKIINDNHIGLNRDEKINIVPEVQVYGIDKIIQNFKKEICDFYDKEKKELSEKKNQEIKLKNQSIEEKKRKIESLEEKNKRQETTITTLSSQLTSADTRIKEMLTEKVKLQEEISNLIQKLEALELKNEQNIKKEKATIERDLNAVYKSYADFDVTQYSKDEWEELIQMISSDIHKIFNILKKYDIQFR